MPLEAMKAGQVYEASPRGSRAQGQSLLLRPTGYEHQRYHPAEALRFRGKYDNALMLV